MSIKHYLVPLLIPLALCCGSSGNDDDDTEPTAVPDGETVWEELTDEDFTSWPLFPGTSEGIPSDEPHSAFATIHVNAAALEAIEREEYPLPDGAMVAKQNLDAAGELVAVTAIKKVEGYNPAAADWFWAKYTSEGEVLVEGKPNGCIGCHVDSEAYDYLQTARKQAGK